MQTCPVTSCDEFGRYIAPSIRVVAFSGDADDDPIIDIHNGDRIVASRLYLSNANSNVAAGRRGEAGMRTRAVIYSENCIEVDD